MSLLRARDPYANSPSIQVVPGLFRGRYPKSVSELRDKNIKQVLSLESGTNEALHESEYEKQLPLAFDIRVMRVDCSGIWAPERHDVRTALTAIRLSLSLKENILVHCKAGVDRTGFIIAVYRMQDCGWTYEQARDEYISMGLHFRFRFWLLKLKDYKEIV